MSGDSIVIVATGVWTGWDGVFKSRLESDISLPQNGHTGSGADPASCSMGTGELLIR
jgi:hypothetical protein